MADTSINMIWGIPTWTDKVAFSGGSYQASAPVTNLGDPDLTLQALTTDLAFASTQFQGVFDKIRGVGLVAIVGHNYAVPDQVANPALIQLQGFSDLALTTVIYDSGLQQVWTPVYGWDDLAWESENLWSGVYTAEEATGYTWTRKFILPQIYQLGGLKVFVRDPNNPAGRLSQAVCEVSQGWQCSVNFDTSSSIGYAQSRTRVSQALGGGKFFDPEPKPRSFSGSVNFMLRSEAMAKALEAWRQYDVHTPFLFIPQPTDTNNAIRTDTYVRLTDMSEFKYASGLRVSFTFKAEEVL